jgi:hypothetical protein
MVDSMKLVISIVIVLVIGIIYWYRVLVIGIGYWLLVLVGG